MSSPAPVPAQPSSIPAVIDYLLATISALPLVTSTQVLVKEGWPGLELPDDVITIGGSTAPTGEDKQTVAQLGAQRREEDYHLTCYISCYREGPSSQKPARDAAFALLAAVDAALRGDATFGGNVRFGQVDDWTYESTDQVTAARGAYAQITFKVRCQKRL